jgi:hypothetical protein
MTQRLQKGFDTLDKYNKYFYKDKDGNLFVRTDFKEHIKEFKRNKLLWFFKTLFSDEGREFYNNVENLGGDVPSTYEERKGFKKPRAEFLSAMQDKMFCVHCGSVDNLTVDHIVPLVKGGTNEVSNFQILCSKCNSRKGARL